MNGTIASPFGTDSWVTIANAAQNTTVDIRVYGEILDSTSAALLGIGVSPSDVAAQLAAAKGKAVTVHVDSPGGSAFSGVAIRSLLVAHDAPVHVVVEGLAASAASIIMTGGSSVSMMAGSMAMIHNAWMFVAGDADYLRQQADVLQKLSANLAGLYAEPSRAKRGTNWARLMADETWFNADEAVAVGLADTVDRGRIAAKASYDLANYGYRRVPAALGGKPRTDADTAQREADRKRVADVQRRIDHDERERWLAETKRRMDADARRLQLQDMQRQTEEIPESTIPREYRNAVARAVRQSAEELHIPVPRVGWSRKTTDAQGHRLLGFVGSEPNTVYVCWPAPSVQSAVETGRHEARHLWQAATHFAGDRERDAETYALPVSREAARKRVREMDALVYAGARR